MPQRDQHAEPAEAEWDGTATTEDRGDVPRRRLALADRVLSGRRVEAARRVGDPRAVAQRPQPGCAGDLQGGLHGERPTRPPRPLHDLPHQRVRPVARRPGQGAGRDGLAGVERDVLGGGPAHPRAETELDAPPAEFALRVEADLGRQLRQQPLPRVHDHEPGPQPVQPRIEVEHVMHQVEELGHQLRTGETAARHHERQQPGLLGRVRLKIGPLQRAQDLVAQRRRVLHGLHREGMLAHARKVEEVRHPADREDQMVVRDAEHPLLAGGDVRAARLRVDRGHPPVQEGGVVEPDTQRGADMPGLHRAGGDADEERGEEQEVRVADQRHMGVEPTADPLVQFARGPHPAEATTDDHHMRSGPLGRRAGRAPGRQGVEGESGDRAGQGGPDELGEARHGHRDRPRRRVPLKEGNEGEGPGHPVEQADEQTDGEGRAVALPVLAEEQAEHRSQHHRVPGPLDPRRVGHDGDDRTAGESGDDAEQECSEQSHARSVRARRTSVTRRYTSRCQSRKAERMFCLASDEMPSGVSSPVVAIVCRNWSR